MDFDSIRREREARRGIVSSDSSPSVPAPQALGARSRITGIATVFTKPAVTTPAPTSSPTPSASPASRFATFKTTSDATARAAAAKQVPVAGGGPLDQAAEYLGIAGRTVTVPPIPAMGFTTPSIVPLIHIVALGVGISFLLFRGTDPLKAFAAAAAGSYMILSSAAAARQK